MMKMDEQKGVKRERVDGGRKGERRDDGGREGGRKELFKVRQIRKLRREIVVTMKREQRRVSHLCPSCRVSVPCSVEADMSRASDPGVGPVTTH